MRPEFHEVLLVKDLARRSGHSVHTIKYYLRIGLIRETSRSPETRFRYFDVTVLERLRKIHELRKTGRSLKDIRNELL